MYKRDMYIPSTRNTDRRSRPSIQRRAKKDRRDESRVGRRIADHDFGKIHCTICMMYDTYDYVL